MFGQKKCVLAVLGFALALGHLVIGQTQASDLDQRLPHNGNAVLILDVAKLLQTPLAKTESWQTKMMSGYAEHYRV